MIRSRRFALSLVCIALLTLAVAPVQADSTFWQDIPAGSQDWFDPVQWTAGVPTSSHEAFIRTGPPVIISSGDAETYYLYLYSKSGYGTGHIVHTGGSLTVSRFYMWSDLEDAPTYRISGSANLSAGWEFYMGGENGTPTFIQDGGTVTTNILKMVEDDNTSARYELHGGSLVIPSGSNHYLQIVGSGNYGNGYFLQTGGTLDTPVISFYGGGSKSGTYEMTGGTLNAGTMQMHYSEDNLFLQTGGTARFTDQMTLTRGGTYHFSDGTLETASVTLAHYIEGSLFMQDGGTHTTNMLSVNEGAKYQLTGGALSIDGGLEVAGTMDFNGGPGTLNIGAGASGDLARGSILNPGQATVNIGTGGFLLLPQGFDPETAFGTWNNQGTSHVAGSTLVIPASQTVNFSGVLEDRVEVQGILQANTSRGIDLTGGLLVSGSGVIDTGEEGSVNISDQTSEIQGGQVTSKGFSLGYYGTTSRVCQSGGLNTIAGGLYMSDSLYEISGGELSCADMYVGAYAYSGETAGNFIQTGGTVRVSDKIRVGGVSPGSLYELIDGEVFTKDLQVGYNSKVLDVFRQNGGSVNADRLLFAGGGKYELNGGVLEVNTIENAGIIQTGGEVTAREVSVNGRHYELEGDGVLSADRLVLGFSKSGRFTQAALSSVVLDKLELTSYDFGHGVYELSGGMLTANTERIGTATGPGDFIQTGGTHNAGQLTVNAAGTYQFSGGILNVSDGFAMDGVMDFCGGDGIVNAGGLVNFGAGEVLNAGLSEFNVLGSESIFIVPAEFDPYSAFGTYTNEGTLQYAGGVLFVPAGETYSASGTVLAHVHAQGQFLASGGQCDLKGGVTIELGGKVDCGEGTVYINDETGIISGGELKTKRLYVGCDSAGMVTQTGGRVTADWYFSVGYNEGVSGMYILDDTGELFAKGARIGSSGNGTFRQLGGTFRITGCWNTLTVEDGGTYEQEGGSFSCSALIVNEGGKYIQSGGTSSYSRANAIYGGTYEMRGGTLSTPVLDVSRSGSSLILTGGTLNINGEADFAGTLDCTGGTGTIDGRGWLDFGGAQILNAGGTTFRLASDSLLILPAGFDPQTDFGLFDNQGVAYSRGSTLVVPAGKGFSGRDKVIYDPVNCAGYIHGSGDDGIDLIYGLTVTEGADVNLGNGKVTCNSIGGDSEVTGGQLICRETDLFGGKFNLTGGGVTVTDRIWIKSGGTFTLGGSGVLSADRAWVITDLTDDGFMQSGGTFTVNDELKVSGRYEMSDGALSAGKIYIAQVGEIGKGKGIFIHTGGTCTVTDEMIVGLGIWSTGPELMGKLELGGTGRLITNIVRMSGDYAVFQQTGGLHKTDQLVLGWGVQSDSTYELSGGELEAGLEYIGRAGIGLFRQTGGINTVRHFIIGENGRYEWTGGTLNITGGSRIDGQFDFAETGKNLTIENAIVDISEGSFVNAGNAALTLGEGSLLIVPEGYDPADVFGSYNNAGLTHVAGMDLTIPVGKTVAGSGTINDPVLCQGTVAVTPGNELNLSGGLDLSSGGRVNILAGASEGYITALTTTDLNVGSDGVGTLNLQNTDANLVVSNSLKFGPGAMLSVTAGSGIHMTGSAFENTSIDPAALADMINLTLIFEGGSSVVDPFEVAGEDMGAVFAGLESNFALGTLQLGGDDIGQLKLVNLFDNQPGWEGSEALYVEKLILGAGSMLDLNGFNLYYFSLGGTGSIPDNIDTSHGGSVQQIPEPATMLLLALGGLAMIKRRR